MDSKARNRLIMLYEAAMLVEQQQSAPATDKLCLASPGRQLRPLSAVSFRSSHNELEKHRRAHLRQCLDGLRDQLPLARGEACRLTILNVLKRSHNYLKELENLAGEQRTRARQQERRRQDLLHRRAQLTRTWRAVKKRAVSAKAAADDKGRGAGAAAAGAADGQANSEAWRSRNASEISITSSASSEETELAHVEATRLRASGPAGGRGAACGSPDSGYASPPSCNGGAVPVG